MTKDRTIDGLRTLNEANVAHIHDCQRQIEELKAQLAEARSIKTLLEDIHRAVQSIPDLLRGR